MDLLDNNQDDSDYVQNNFIESYLSLEKKNY